MGVCCSSRPAETEISQRSPLECDHGKVRILEWFASIQGTKDSRFTFEYRPGEYSPASRLSTKKLADSAGFKQREYGVGDAPPLASRGGIDTEHDNLSHHVVGAILLELEVCNGITLIVSVAANAQVDVGIGL